MDYEYSDEYPTCRRTYTTLRVFSAALDSSEISGILGILPSNSYEKGDLPKGTKRPRAYSGWFYSTEGRIETKDFRRHLDWIIDQLRGKEDRVEMLRSKDCKIELMSFWVGVGQGGPKMEASQMKFLGELNLSIWWDIYFEEDEFRDISEAPPQDANSE